MTFKIFGTAGDAGLRAEAGSLGQLLAELALGFAELSSPEKAGTPDARTVTLSAASPGELAVKFLNELVYLADTEGFLPSSAAARVTEKAGALALEAALKGEADAFSRRARGLLVKAATYHNLKVEERAGRWYAEVILDI